MASSEGVAGERNKGDVDMLMWHICRSTSREAPGQYRETGRCHLLSPSATAGRSPDGVSRRLIAHVLGIARHMPPYSDIQLNPRGRMSNLASDRDLNSYRSGASSRSSAATCINQPHQAFALGLCSTCDCASRPITSPHCRILNSTTGGKSQAFLAGTLDRGMVDGKHGVDISNIVSPRER